MKNDNITPLYRLSGTIIHGKGKGKTVGMPTANLQVRGSEQLPPPGVYAALAHIRGGTYLGVTNVGTRPTVDNESAVTVETHILGFSGDLYGSEMLLDICKYLRPIRRMASLEEVKKQVDTDCENTREYLKDFV
jgi:riboflavin kinase/FMN adenylyltransferase